MITTKNVPAARFSSNQQQYLSVPDNPTINMGHGNFTFASWVKFDTLLVDQDIFSKTVTLKYDSTQKTLNFIMGLYNVLSSDTTPLSTNTWYLIAAWIDAYGKTLNISINNNIISSNHYDGMIPSDNSPLALGGTADFLNGSLSTPAIWQRLLGKDEISNLYKDGVGITFSDIQTTYPNLLSGLSSWWTLGESAGEVRVSDTDTQNNLSDYGGVSLTSRSFNVVVPDVVPGPTPLLPTSGIIVSGGLTVIADVESGHSLFSVRDSFGNTPFYVSDTDVGYTVGLQASGPNDIPVTIVQAPDSNADMIQAIDANANQVFSFGSDGSYKVSGLTDTSEDQLISTVTPYWLDSSNDVRRGALSFVVTDSTTSREFLRGWSDGTGPATTLFGQVTLTPTLTGEVPLTIVPVQGQQANLQQWVDSNSDIQSFVDKNGSFVIGAGGATTFGLALCGRGMVLAPVANPTAPNITPVYTQVSTLSDPVNAPVVTTSGSGDSTTYIYFIVAKDGEGYATLPSPSGSITSGSVTLDVDNYNIITWDAIDNATNYDVVFSDPVSGFIGIGLSVADTAFIDVGMGGTTYTLPNSNTTGTPGTTTYTYYIVARNAAGVKTLASPLGFTSGGTNGVLSDRNYNSISWLPITWAVGYDVITTATPNGFTVLATNIPDTTFNDTGLGGMPHTLPTSNDTARMLTSNIHARGNLFVDNDFGVNTGVIDGYGLSVYGRKSQFQPLLQPTTPMVTPVSNRPHLANPLAPTIGYTGSGGTTTYAYQIVAKDAQGNHTLPSPTGSVDNSNDILDVDNYNFISWDSIANAVNYDVIWVSPVSGTVAIASGVVDTTFSDIGAGGVVYTLPDSNTTGPSGNTTYIYAIVAKNIDGHSTLISPSGYTTVGSDTGLDSLSYNQVNWGVVTGAYSYDVLYYDLSGYVGVSLNQLVTTFSDFGAGGLPYNLPVVNSTGDLETSNVSVSGSLSVIGNTGFSGNIPIAPPIVTGSVSGGTALASLISAFSEYGLIIDSTTP